jgi:hypothetical protein
MSNETPRPIMGKGYLEEWAEYLASLEQYTTCIERENARLREELAEAKRDREEARDIHNSNMNRYAERAEQAEARFLLLSAQHVRLCDQVYEEDGETLRHVTAEARALANEKDAEIGRLIRQKLNSLNGIPMERCTVLAKEIAAIDAALAGGK